MTHERKCWDCGYLGQFTSDVVPGVLCPKCGSQDTRRQRSEQEARQIALDDFLRESAAEFAKAHAKQAAADASKPRDGIIEAVKLKMWSRSARGLAKYGTTLEHNHARLRERITHLQEELMDACNYCEWILQYIDDRAAVDAVESERKNHE